MAKMLKYLFNLSLERTFS